ncbi:28S ribosomal protein S2, mitochondrial isoform X2 [Cotesia glomerata]|uniref:28S ribosomal protein S2, mitochondrial isoform X2 n=1 Tax=Cotesia glomerata TaxID=32391 RepID=UPI001D0109F9|nr:28S ribosomal protein S2, mitochondrial isoform X2 [Cotesia glomerata]
MLGHSIRISSALSFKLLRPFLRVRNFSTQTEPLPSQSESEFLNPNDPPLIDPLKHPDFFGVHQLFTVKDLFDARVHYGHKIGSLDDRMKPFIFGSRLGHLIFDLDQTAVLLREALNFTAHTAFRKGVILFVCRNPQVTHLVEKTALECKEFAHTRFWLDGIFTDSTKKFKAVTRLPDLVILINTLNDVLRQNNAVRDSAKMCIPTVGIVDTNCNPNLVTYPVPGNDDTPVAVELYCKLFKEAIMRGKSARAKLFHLLDE